MIGQTQFPEDPWFVVTLLLALITLVGVSWAVVRERRLMDMNTDQTKVMKDVEHTVSDGFRTITRQVERSEELSESHRQEMIRLVVDVERRITDAFRYTSGMGVHPGYPTTNVNFHGGAQGTQIGDGNHQI